jgi:SAM-dependent methyltransferase
MIIDKLIRHHLRHGDDDGFYLMQAEDALRWMEASGVKLGPGTRVLDLGCGHGVFGAQFAKRGCLVTFSDTKEYLRPDLRGMPFRIHEVGTEDLGDLGQYDLVLFSNVFEHLARPEVFLREMHKVLAPGGVMFLSWTNWLSPWGGHDFSPFHYLGPRLGPKVFDFLRPGKRVHHPFAGLYPTYIGRTLREIGRLPGLEVWKVAPRYYTEFAWLMRIPVVREFLAWNCAMLIRRRG